MIKKQSVPLFEKAYFRPDRRPVEYNLRYNDLEHYKPKRLGESVFGGDPKLKKTISEYYDGKPSNITLIEGGCSNANFHVFYSLLNIKRICILIY